MRWLFVLLTCLITTISDARPLIIGTAPENPPLSFQADKNHFYGFEVDLMNDICKRIHLSCIYKPVESSDVLSELANGKIDIAIAALILPSKPTNGLAFSLPYLQTGGQFMTLASSLISTPLNLKNKKVGVRRGTLTGGDLYKKLVMEIYDNQVTVIEYLSMDALMAALSNKEIDAVFSNELPIMYWYHNHQKIYKLIGSNIPLNNSYAIMSNKKNIPLIEKINHGLLDTIADGTYLKIYNRYFSSLR